MEGTINKALSRAIRTIEIMAKNKFPMRLQEIANKVGIPESTALRILNTLITYGYAQQDHLSKHYLLTLKISYLGNLVKSSLDIRKIARPYLEELSRVCEESASLVIEQNMEAVYIDFVEGPDKLLRTLALIGRAAPLHTTAVGKCLLLNYSSLDIERYIEIKGLVKLTNNSITSREKLLDELKKVRNNGYAVDNEECEVGVRCVAAPIRDYMDKIIASISITGPTTRLTKDMIEKLKDMVIQTAKKISFHFGSSGSI